MTVFDYGGIYVDWSDEELAKIKKYKNRPGKMKARHIYLSDEMWSKLVQKAEEQEATVSEFVRNILFREVL